MSGARRRDADRAIGTATMRSDTKSGTITRRRALAAVGIAAVLALYLVALWWRRDTVPPGLNNDVAEEALRGMYLVDGPHFEVVTFAIGNSAETLYLYLLGVMVRALGPTTLAIQLLSWGFALAILALLPPAVRRIDPAVPAWVPLLIGVSSVWLFHYARSGLRTIAAPLFLLGFVLLLDRVERDAASRAASLAAGATLGLSIYAYTACRILPVAFLVYAGARVLGGGPNRRARLRAYGWLLVGAVVVSIPNLIFLVERPRDFLLRGSYVVSGTWRDAVDGLLATVILPFHYLDRYRALGGPGFFFDGVCSGLTATGIDPVHPIVAIALAIGLYRAAALRRVPLVGFLASVWLVGLVTLGSSGPSLTRQLILLPVFLVAASLGAAKVAAGGRAAAVFAAAALVLAGATHARTYFVEVPRSPNLHVGHSAAVAPLAERARVLADDGKRVVCVVSRDRAVVRYLTHGRDASIRLVEFFNRPADPRELRIASSPPDVVLVEAIPAFDPLTRALGDRTDRSRDPLFHEIRFDVR